ncbi:MAG: tRNA (guanosine(46)-N7)-methyltransferase TrmB [Eubacterium sp.]|nr:tRNA (guanosine(46)-N7)-methyltransferase TrmB [Candidatus Colimonas fimequi]
MRQRKVKDLDLKLAQCSDLLVENPDPAGWNEHFGREADLYVEVGCGKGDFIIKKAMDNPDSNFVAIEGQGTVVLRAMEKVRELEGTGTPVTNLRFMCAFVNDMREFFEEGSLAGIYLNFSDPWPKARHNKRRLTYRGRLENYAKVLVAEGFLEFKTDNDGLYDFTLEEIEAVDYDIIEKTRDLHASQYESRLTMTEYEKKFKANGKNINYVKIKSRKGQTGGNKMILARQNGRVIPKEDINFATSRRANAMKAEVGADKVINATIGTLMDDEGKLIVLSSVNDVFQTLEPGDYAAYAPIGGIPEFKEAAKKAAFGSYVPKAFTEVCATPGGTGSLRNSIANYSEPGDAVMTTDWCWGPYKTIAGEIGRTVRFFELFDANRQFNTASFKETATDILANQNSIVIILNTPAHNPTGYSLTLEDWDNVVAVLTELAATGKTICLVVDMAYIDFAGDEEEYRQFLPKLDTMPENVLPIIAYSASKTYTLYGARCGAMICMAKTQEIADEFKQVTEFSSRGSWSNGNRAAQVMISKIYSDEALLAKVSEERAYYRDMLLARGKAFEEEANKIGLEIVPFDAGFFASVPCDNPMDAYEKLAQEGAFLIPLAKGLRISIASISEEKCRKLPAMIKAAIE